MAGGTPRPWLLQLASRHRRRLEARGRLGAGPFRDWLPAPGAGWRRSHDRGRELLAEL